MVKKMADDKRKGRRPVEKHYSPPGQGFDGSEEDERGEIIEGRNAVIEALRAGRRMDKVYIVRGDTDATLGHIASTAREKGAVVVDADKRKLDVMSRTKSHQGVIALVGVKEYCEVSDILDLARERGEKALVIVCDELSDPHNLGAIIRTAECAGAHGVIIPKRRSAGATPIVAKASAGAIEHMLVARVANISSAIRELKDGGVWVFGADTGDAAPMYSADFRGDTAIIIGSEGSGMGRLVRENCDALVSIPMKGQTSSLNASTAAAVLLYEVMRQRANTEIH